MLKRNLSFFDHSGWNDYPARSVEHHTLGHNCIRKDATTILRSKCTDQLRFNPERFAFRQTFHQFDGQPIQSCSMNRPYPLTLS